MPDEDKTFSGSLVLDLRILWRQTHTLYLRIKPNFRLICLVISNYISFIKIENLI